jgi:GAF domain-containing protein
VDGSIKMLAETFLQLVDNTADDFDPIELLKMLCRRCIELFDVSEAAVALVDANGVLRVVASSSDQATRLAQFQIDTEGPCLDAYRSGRAVFHLDLDRAWPCDTNTASLRSVHAFPMRARDQAVGTLNLFRTQPRSLWDTDVTLAQTFADAAAIALLQDRAISALHQLTVQLQGALKSRVIIEQAKGTIAEHAGVTMDEAYARLLAYARNHQTKLTNVAEAIVARSLSPDIGTAIGTTRRPRLTSQR